MHKVVERKNIRVYGILLFLAFTLHMNTASAESCENGATKENASNCTSYYECCGGEFVIKYCDTGYYWNTGSSKCIAGQCNNDSGNSTDSDCTSGSGSGNGGNGGSDNSTCDAECCNVANEDLVAIPNNCSSFISCLNGFKFVLTCPNNLQFNSNTKQCDYPQNVNCDDGSLPPSGPNAGPSGIYCETGGRCVGKVDGAMLSGSTSGSYIVCQCECEIDMVCPSGLVFNQAEQSCDWASTDSGSSDPSQTENCN